MISISTNAVLLIAGSSAGFLDGQGAGARFSGPDDIVVDSTGNLFVVEQTNHAIRMISANGLVVTLAGGLQGFADGQGSAAMFSYPYGIAMSGDLLFVSDHWNCAIRIVTRTGMVSTLAGSPKVCGFSDGQGQLAKFNYPTFIAFATSALFVSDRDNNLVRTLSLSLALPICDATWHHVSVTYSPPVSSLSTLSAFVDGAIMAQMTAVSPLFSLPPATSSELRIGWGSNVGVLADLRIYSRAISAKEAVALSQPSASHVGASLVATSFPSLGASFYHFSCAAGSAGPNSGSTLVKSPVDNSWAWEPTDHFCTPCAAGSWAPQGTTACTPCPPGTFSLAGAASCTLCPAGTFGASAGATSALCSGVCALCAAGSTVSVTAAQLCPAGSVPSGAGVCAPCAPGTFATAGAASCSLCPAGTFGGSAGLMNSTCSGVCEACAAGSVFPPLANAISCASSGARAAPASLGLLLWPAAHPANSLHLDLIIAPLIACRQLISEEACASAMSVVGADGMLRYVLGTAAALHLEAAEPLTCAAQ
jgi:hypothetical protein